jgi:thiol-disulfide isomerase/thioredoxin
MLALCLGLAGCSLFGKKSPNAGPTPPAHPPAPAARPGGSPPPPDPPGGAAASPFSGILAGQVIDSYNRRPPPTHIKVVQVKDKDGKDHAPIELDWVAADSNGYFMIQKLQPGRHYHLIAVAKDGERKLAGDTWVTPPDPRVLIRISEDFKQNAPDPPASPGAPKPNRPADTSRGPPPPNWGDTSTLAGDPPGVSGFGLTGPSAPPGGSGLHRAVELGTPVPRHSNPPPPPVSRPENVVGDNRAWPPTINVPGGTAAPASPSPGVVPPPVTTVAPPVVTAAPVPFCVLTGRQLDNFALYDLNGQPWEYRRNRRGRLLLVDFWKSNCLPCLHAMHHLNGWQQMYGPYGLEIVGIAYEEGTPEEQVRKVRGIRDSRRVNYPLLLGTSPADRCPVRKQFQALYFPTLVLIDETGQIAWRGQGFDGQQMKELEYEIRRRLGLH